MDLYISRVNLILSSVLASREVKEGKQTNHVDTVIIVTCLHFLFTQISNLNVLLAK